MISIIDLDPVLHIVANVQWAAGNHTDFQRVKDHTRQFVNNVIKSCETDEYVMFFQDSGHNNYRNTILPEYKGHRQKNEAIEAFKSTICEVLKEFGAHPLYNIESDDALSLWVNKCIQEGKDYLIVENDKDLAMLPGDHYNPYKTQPTNKPPIVRRYSFSDEDANLSFWCQVATGDSTDMPNSMCGIEKCGPVTAKRQLESVFPELRSLKVVKMYTEQYGMSVGLRRMALTYDLIKLIRRELKEIPETKTVLLSTPLVYSDDVSALFDNKEENKNLFQ